MKIWLQKSTLFLLIKTWRGDRYIVYDSVTDLDKVFPYDHLNRGIMEKTPKDKIEEYIKANTFFAVKLSNKATIQWSLFDNITKKESRLGEWMKELNKEIKEANRRAKLAEDVRIQYNRKAAEFKKQPVFNQPLKNVTNSIEE